MSAPTPAQVAAIEALRHGEGAVQEMVAQYDQRCRLIVKGFNEIGLPCCEPHGVFYAFPSIQHSGLTSDEFSKRLLQEEKVAVIPGSAFGQCGEGFGVPTSLRWRTSKKHWRGWGGSSGDTVDSYHLFSQEQWKSKSD